MPCRRLLWVACLYGAAATAAAAREAAAAAADAAAADRADADADADAAAAAEAEAAGAGAGDADADAAAAWHRLRRKATTTASAAAVAVSAAARHRGSAAERSARGTPAKTSTCCGTHHSGVLAAMLCDSLATTSSRVGHLAARIYGSTHILLPFLRVFFTPQDRFQNRRRMTRDPMPQTPKCRRTDSKIGGG